MSSAPPAPLEPADSGACAALLAAGERLARLVEAELQDRHRLGLRALEVLDRLAAAPPGAGVRITGLLERARLSQSRMSRLVAELEGRGLVSRASCPGDARGVEVAITRRGRRALDEARVTHAGALRERVVARLDPDELAALGRIAAKLLEDEAAGGPFRSASSAPSRVGSRRRCAPACPGAGRTPPPPPSDSARAISATRSRAPGSGGEAVMRPPSSTASSSGPHGTAPRSRRARQISVTAGRSSHSASATSSATATSVGP